ncbi:MAG: MvaI/BcnI family restriction endonuclease [Acinetobacter sp.]
MSVNLKPISKIELIEKFKQIEALGWIENTTRQNNDGAVGNKLEDLLGIPENNLPIPNAAEWELKTQRDNTTSLLTLFHLEPSPRALNIVPTLLLLKYGWPHQQAEIKYPKDEKSFRGTLNATTYTRGFRVCMNNEERKVCIQFDANKVIDKDQEWLQSVQLRVGNLNDLDPMPYWGFDDLFSKARTKLLNCFYVQAEIKTENQKTFFHYYRVLMLHSLNLNKFLAAMNSGKIYIDFDARTGHNHGTKFRLRASDIPELYETVTVVIDAPKLKTAKMNGRQQSKKLF